MRTRLKRHAHQVAAREFDRWFVQVITRRKDHHIVTRMDQRLDGGEDQGRSSGPNRHLGFGVVTYAALPFRIRGNPLPQPDIARHGSVLIAAFCHCCDNGLLKGLWWLEIRKALAHVQRSVSLRHGTHLCENGGAHAGQLGRGTHIAHACKLGRAPFIE